MTLVSWPHNSLIISRHKKVLPDPRSPENVKISPGLILRAICTARSAVSFSDFKMNCCVVTVLFILKIDVD